MDLLKTVKSELAKNLPLKTMQILKISFDFDTDIYEALGFSNGKKPYTDVREGTGILGLISVLSFIERTKKIYS